VKAERGIGRPREHANSLRHRPTPGGVPQTHRSATCQGTMTSARISRLPGAVRRRSRATEMLKGGLETTRNGRRGNRTSAPSVCTTMTLSLANSLRRSLARAGCNSNAMTRAPRRTRGRVSAPLPAPMSSTRSPDVIPAFSMSRSAQRLSSRCHPHRVGFSDTADHREHCHPTTIRQELMSTSRLILKCQIEDFQLARPGPSVGITMLKMAVSTVNSASAGHLPCRRRRPYPWHDQLPNSALGCFCEGQIRSTGIHHRCRGGDLELLLGVTARAIFNGELAGACASDDDHDDHDDDHVGRCTTL